MTLMLKKIDELLDEMAPVKNLSKKELEKSAKPWLTSGILKAITNRDRLHKEFLVEKKPE